MAPARRRASSSSARPGRLPLSKSLWHRLRRPVLPRPALPAASREARQVPGAVLPQHELQERPGQVPARAEAPGLQPQQEGVAAHRPHRGLEAQGLPSRSGAWLRTTQGATQKPKSAYRPTPRPRRRAAPPGEVVAATPQPVPLRPARTAAAWIR
jgi:hypothetical protein